MINKIELLSVQSSPVTIVNPVHLNNVMIENMHLIENKLNELILILNSVSIANGASTNESDEQAIGRRGRPKKSQITEGTVGSELL